MTARISLRGWQRCGECTGELTRGEEGKTELDGEAQRLSGTAIVAGLLGSTRSSPNRAGAITRSTRWRRRKELGTGGSGGKESQRWARRQQWRRDEGDWRIYRRRAAAQRLGGRRGLPATEEVEAKGVSGGEWEAEGSGRRSARELDRRKKKLTTGAHKAEKGSGAKGRTERG